MHDDDRALRDQLRAADPTRALPPASPTWLDHRMEQIMTDQSVTTPTVTPETPRRAFRRWMPVAGVAAGLAIAAAIVVPLVLGGPEPTVEALQPPMGGGLASGSCLVLEPTTVAAQEQAFAATVLQIQGNTVLLEVTERFVGEVADRVEVAQVDAMTSDFSGVPFAVGQSYLVGAVDGTITGCGVTGADSAELRAVYDAAFPG
ncbi:MULTISPECIES: hypothetical protein [Cryobacterium]|uniref:Uncharacterized protein n=1 Tax=Cryobacterium levicorallinum TaxID=995038 RepID=A0A1I3ECK6_9MICO|nr:MULTISPECIES: hypothetical protein [Cryobacterium]TFB84369.1 hypothetical protein E3O11_09720 [Cryobacterium levicorallinum]TFD65514.1 hypothetical protein E3T41_01680 [Cryobacterium sp. Hh38]GEP28703.1 hypothetical protein CLE01_33010 [Cryobacterium levicorallinum]SFH96720.1 hypothetical protein SAMN05216274_12438 [Cryobacterium levicorallinum]